MIQTCLRRNILIYSNILISNKYNPSIISPSLSFLSRQCFSNDHTYKNKTSKEIQIQISNQKWKQLQNTFKSLNSKFGLRKPTGQQLNNTKFLKPTKIEYTLQSLRQCSRQFPVYLYLQLLKPQSPFNQLIQKIVDNLWKADQKQTLQFLQFLSSWQYDKIDVLELHKVVLGRFDLSLEQIFVFLKRYNEQIYDAVQINVLKRLTKAQLASDEYSPLLRIINYFNLKKLMKDHFYIAVTSIVSRNINKIKPSQALQAYVFYTYNIDQFSNFTSKNGEIKKEESEEKDKNAQQEVKGGEELVFDIVNIIEKRILSPQCIKFYNGEQLVALLHTFIKNNLIIKNESKFNREIYNEKLQKIITRIEYGYLAHDFSTKEKSNLLQISTSLPQLSKLKIITLVQTQLLKKSQKFDYKLLPQLYLISFEENLLTEELLNSLQDGIIKNIFHIEKRDISRVAWLFTITGSKYMNGLHEKIKTILQGGMNEFKIKDICILIWTMCANNFQQNDQIWDNIEAYLFQQLQRIIRQIEGLDKEGNQNKLINQCSWILWSYHNNRQMSIKTIDLITDIILNTFSSMSNKTLQNVQKQMSSFQLLTFISFYFSINLPSQSLMSKIREICFEQFELIYKSMGSIQLCKCLKYIGGFVWRREDLRNGIIEIFEIQQQKIAYRDIMTVVSILLSSNIKNSRVLKLLKKLLERKKRLESLSEIGNQVVSQQAEKKEQKWKFPF